MSITPQDIQSKQFHVRMRGFDVDEVDRFLEKIAEEFLILTLENKQIMEKVESLEKEIANYRNKEQTFQNAILSAQRISEEMQEKSRLEAESTLSLAKKESEDLQARIRQEAESLQEQAIREAKELKEKAKAEAVRIENNARTQIYNLTLEVNNLIDMRQRITDDLKQLLADYLQKINEGVPSTLKGLEKLPEPEFPDPQSARMEQQTHQTTEPDDDIGDLYEKINLSEDGEVIENDSVSENHHDPEELGLEDIELIDLEEEQLPGTRVAINAADEDSLDHDPDISIPDLDGEMLFSLEDPLDEMEPSITISPKENTNR